MTTPTKNSSSTGTATLNTSVFNMLKACIGSGVLALPFCLKTLGWLLFLCLLFPSAYIAWFSIYLLAEVCEYYDVFSYEEATQKTFLKSFGWPNFGSMLAGFFIWAQSLASVTGYSFIIKSQLPELIKFVLEKLQVCVSNESYYLNGNFILASIMILVLFPLACFRKLDFLKYSSLLGVGAMLTTGLIIAAFKFKVSCEDLLIIDDQTKNATAEQVCQYQPDADSLKDWKNFEDTITSIRKNNVDDPSSNNDICSTKATNSLNSDFGGVVNTIIFSFNLHDAVMSIYSSLRNGSKTKMMKVSTISFLIVCSLYLIVGFFGYLTWKGFTVSDILLMYSKTSPDSVVIFAARLFVCTSVAFSIPIYTFAARRAFWRVFFPSDLEQRKSNEISCFGELVSGEAAKHHLFSVFFLGLALSFAMAGSDNLGGILWACGLVSICIYIVIPPILWILTFISKNNYLSTEKTSNSNETSPRTFRSNKTTSTDNYSSDSSSKDIVRTTETLADDAMEIQELVDNNNDNNNNNFVKESKPVKLDIIPIIKINDKGQEFDENSLNSRKYVVNVENKQRTFIICVAMMSIGFSALTYNFYEKIAG